jgi:hypothetical protein
MKHNLNFPFFKAVVDQNLKNVREAITTITDLNEVNSLGQTALIVGKYLYL